MKIAIGSDHAGFEVKQHLIKQLHKEGHRVMDMGTNKPEACDYPDIAQKVARAVASGRFERGILACGTGIGMAIAANKVSGIRAASTWSIRTAKLAAEHNWLNILCVPSRVLSLKTIKKMVSGYLATPFDKGGRHERRVQKISEIELK